MLCFLFQLWVVELQVLVYGKYECFVMQMLYVCVLCEYCGSSQFYMTIGLLMLVEDAMDDHMKDE